MKNVYIVTSADTGEIARYTVKRTAEAHRNRYNKNVDKLRAWRWERRAYATIEVLPYSKEL